MRSEISRSFYRRLLALYPRRFRERFGESMQQTFDDLCIEREEQRAGLFGLVFRNTIDTGIGITREHISEFKNRRIMADQIAGSTKRAVLGLLLSLPALTLFSLFVLNIEPPLGPLEPLLTNSDPDKPDIGGSLVALFFVLLMPVAVFINLRPLVKNRLAGHGIAASPLNLILAVAVFGFFAWIVGAVIVDLYPCWIGAPNCD